MDTFCVKIALSNYFSKLNHFLIQSMWCVCVFIHGFCLWIYVHCGDLPQFGFSFGGGGYCTKFAPFWEPSKLLRVHRCIQCIYMGHWTWMAYLKCWWYISKEYVFHTTKSYHQHEKYNLCELTLKVITLKWMLQSVCHVILYNGCFVFNGLWILRLFGI